MRKKFHILEILILFVVFSETLMSYAKLFCKMWLGGIKLNSWKMFSSDFTQTFYNYICLQFLCCSIPDLFSTVSWGKQLSWFFWLAYLFVLQKNGWNNRFANVWKLLYSKRKFKATYLNICRSSCLNVYAGIQNGFWLILAVFQFLSSPNDL